MANLNTYETRFAAACPVNGQRVIYHLRIETMDVLRVESIQAHVQQLTRGLHEAFADSLLTSLGGKQTLTAEHHGVRITTTRGDL